MFPHIGSQDSMAWTRTSRSSLCHPSGVKLQVVFTTWSLSFMNFSNTNNESLTKDTRKKTNDHSVLKNNESIKNTLLKVWKSLYRTCCFLNMYSNRQNIPSRFRQVKEASKFQPQAENTYRNVCGKTCLNYTVFNTSVLSNEYICPLISFCIKYTSKIFTEAKRFAHLVYSRLRHIMVIESLKYEDIILLCSYVGLK